MQLTRWTWNNGGEPETARPLLGWFGWQMEETLRRNDHKPCWQSYPTIWPLVWKLLEEVLELVWECIRARLHGKREDRIVAEASDVAVVAMAIADWFFHASHNRGRDDVW